MKCTFQCVFAVLLGGKTTTPGKLQNVSYPQKSPTCLFVINPQPLEVICSAFSHHGLVCLFLNYI